MLPTFLVIGAMKAGTTSLFHYLADHPDVAMPWMKEIDFFSDDTKWARGIDWYSGHFTTPAIGVGEASPNYSKRHLFPATAQRIADTLPEVRLIYVIRDPIERLQSMYVDMLAYGGEQRSIDDAVMDDGDYVLTSCYGYQLQPYVELMGSGRILVVDAARLQSDRLDTLAKVYAFIGVRPGHVPAELDPVATNPREHKAVPTELGRRLLSKTWYARRVAAVPGFGRLHARLSTRSPRQSDVVLSPDIRAQLTARFDRDAELLASLFA